MANVPPASDVIAPLAREAFAALDARDPLGALRARFALPDGVTYLDGNSLGALPRTVHERVARTIVHEWGERLIRSWNEANWIDLPRRVGAKLAPLIGARADEVIACDNTSLNLLKLILAACAKNAPRTTIVTEVGNFPTDNYIAQGVARMSGGRLRLKQVARETLVDALDQDTALLMLTEVDYRSGERHDIAALTRAAHAVGALTLWDLSHSAGALHIALNEWNADFATGCGYKFLNGGPGAPAYVFVAQRHFDAPALASGWLGHRAPFDFAPDYEPAPGVARFLTGTPAILALTALDAALDAFAGVDTRALEAKAHSLTQHFIALADTRLTKFGLRVASARDVVPRGAHVCLAHEQGYAIMQALIARDVIGDFRPPNLLRFGFAPLYNRYLDAWRAAETLEAIMQSAAWREPRFAQRATVT